MTSDSVWQIIRYLLIAVGGYFTNKGIITADQWTAIVSALGTLFVAGWGIYVKFGTKATTASAAASPAVPTVSPATGTVQK